MTVRMPSYQSGFSLEGLMLGAFFVVLLSILGIKVIPAYMENATIENIFTVIANDPDMQQASPEQMKLSFSKRADIEGVDAITPNEIEIASAGGRLYLSASYSVTIPLVANVSLLLEFSPSSAK